MQTRVFWGAVVVALAAAGAANAAVEMPGIFSDHMVLQCDMPVPVWGKAAPGEKVKVSFRGQVKGTTADDQGRWTVKLGAMKALPDQKPDVLTVEGENRIEFKDVVVGEVWLGSGQSNMVWPVSNCRDAKEEIEAANEPMIRLSSNTLWPSYETPRSDWVLCSPGTVHRFSALMYYFGRNLQRELKVPVGLICRAVSGSAACPWISTNGFMAYQPLVEEYKAYSEKEYPALKEAYDLKVKEWEDQCAKAREALAARVAVLESTNFEAEIVLTKGVPVPGTNQSVVAWREGRLKLKFDANGGCSLGWLTVDRRVGLTVEKCEGTASRTQDEVNVEAAVTFRQGTNAPALPAQYQIRATRKGAAFTGKAGITAQDSRQETDVRGSVVLLDAEKEPRKPGGPPRGTYPEAPDCGSWHAKYVEPTVPYAVRGVLWDQGESGTGYRGLKLSTVAAGIADSWRKERGIDFPFLFVQKPSGGGWQWTTNLVDRAGRPVPRPALPPSPSAAFATNQIPGAYSFLELMRIPNSRMCIALDLDAGIHPFNKHDYAHRLARIALSDTYRRHSVYYGPIYRSHAVEDAGGKDGPRKVVRIRFDYVGKGLEARGGEPLQGFSIAGPDRQFAWADARIDKDTVLVWSDKVQDPQAVRYAWSDAPSWANLFNKDGLPALIFRTDTW